MKILRIVLLFGCLSAIPISCSHVDPHENFLNSMQSDVGTKTNENLLFTSPTLLKHVELIKQLPNGNDLYRTWWQDSCRVYHEVDPETSIIMDWYWEGKKEDCVINP